MSRTILSEDQSHIQGQLFLHNNRLDALHTLRDRFQKFPLSDRESYYRLPKQISLVEELQFEKVVVQQQPVLQLQLRQAVLRDWQFARAMKSLLTHMLRFEPGGRLCLH